MPFIAYRNVFKSNIALQYYQSDTTSPLSLKKSTEICEKYLIRPCLYWKRSNFFPLGALLQNCIPSNVFVYVLSSRLIKTTLKCSASERHIVSPIYQSDTIYHRIDGSKYLETSKYKLLQGAIRLVSDYQADTHILDNLADYWIKQICTLTSFESVYRTATGNRCQRSPYQFHFLLLKIWRDPFVFAKQSASQFCCFYRFWIPQGKI